jgi:hypothetical protein
MWESSRPIRPSRAKSVWSPDTHEWEAEHLWSGAGWQTAAEPETDAGPATAAREQETLFPEPEIVLPEPAPVGDWEIALVPFHPNEEEEPASAPGPAPGGATEAALARVEEVLAQAMQDDGPDLQPPLPGTPDEPTAGELARIEALLDRAFPRHDDPGPGDPGDDAFFDVNALEGDPPVEGSPDTSESPPATRPDRPPAERGWFLTRRPRRGQPPR